MPTLEGMFEQAVTVRRTRTNPPSVQLTETEARLETLHRQATSGDPSQREAAMRHYIQLVGEMQQQDS